MFILFFILQRMSAQISDQWLALSYKYLSPFEFHHARIAGVGSGFSPHDGFQSPRLSVFRVSTDRATCKTKKNRWKRKESRREIRFPSEVAAA